MISPLKDTVGTVGSPAAPVGPLVEPVSAVNIVRCPDCCALFDEYDGWSVCSCVSEFGDDDFVPRDAM